MVSAIIVAAGSGKRFGGPKQFEEVFGKPLIYYSLLAFQSHPGVDDIVLVMPEEFLEVGETLKAHFKKLVHVVRGGEERGDSVFEGLEVAQGETVLIHDGARPLVDVGLIGRVIDALENHKAVVPALSPSDTVKELSAGHAKGALNRSKLLLIQTPQGFERTLLISSYEKAFKAKVYATDDSTIVEEYGNVASTVVPGSPRNLKVTTREDLRRVEGLLSSGIRLGFGYDVHELVDGRELWLGGVKVPFEKGLLGHSDGDVVVHAVIDALLGAAGLPDIGRQFPDSDPEYKDIRSLLLLKKTGSMVKEKGFSILDIDATLALERPKIAPHADEMAGTMADALSVPSDSISVKGKRGEGLGPVGEGRAAVCYAVALLLSGSSSLQEVE
jgi:2-C-methyl-D-erythritol 4-phosphate cytidylyltransferase/2-C-methyl-D-erythritol 2,4-cyclodiphosphate synthase